MAEGGEHNGRRLLGTERTARRKDNTEQSVETTPDLHEASSTLLIGPEA